MECEAVMADREKIKEWLETRLKDPVMKCDFCTRINFYQLCLDMLEVLKEREPVAPHISKSYRLKSGRMSRRRAWCGACGLMIRIGSNRQDRSKYCERCGREVKWE